MIQAPKQKTPDSPPDAKRPDCDCAARLAKLEKRVSDLEERGALSTPDTPAPFDLESTDYVARAEANILKQCQALERARKEASKLKVPAICRHPQ